LPIRTAGCDQEPEKPDNNHAETKNLPGRKTQPGMPRRKGNIRFYDLKSVSEFYVRFSEIFDEKPKGPVAD
jgi:hypothetical protein